MKKFTPNGSVIKRLRANLDRLSTEKEMANAIGVSDRKYRMIENDAVSAHAGHDPWRNFEGENRHVAVDPRGGATGTRGGGNCLNILCDPSYSHGQAL